MRNTIIVSIILFIAVILASVYYFGDLNKEKQESVKPITYLPADTYFIASFINDAATDNIFKDFEIFEAILGKSKQQELNHLKQQLLRNKELSNYLADVDIFVSVHPAKEEKSLLFSFPSKEELSKEQLDPLMNNLSKQFQMKGLDTLGHHFYGFTAIQPDSLSQTLQKTPIYVAYDANIFFASFDKELLIKVLDKKVAKLDKDQIAYFNENNNHKAPFTIYLPQQNLESLVGSIKQNKAGDFLKQFIHLKGQSVWNINYKQDALMLSGETELEDQEKEYIALFANQQKTKQDLYQLFPSNTAIFIEYSFSNAEKWFSDLKSWQQKTATSTQFADQENQINKDKPNLLQDFQSVISGNFAIIEQNNGDYLGFIRISDSSKFDRIVNALAESVSDDLYRFRYANIPYRFFGDGLQPFSRPYFFLLNNTLVLANQQSTLQEYIQKWERKDLLIGNISFKNYEQLQGNDANVTFYLNNKNASNRIENALNGDYGRKYRDKEEYGFQDFHSWSLQLTGNSGNFLSRFYALYKSKNRLGVQPDWTYAMRSRLINGPYVFEQSDTSQFILAQEQDHTVHALLPNGKKLWSSVFSGRIVGKVQQLPDKSLLAVTDRRRLYRFDAAGNNLKGFSTSVSAEPIAQPLYVNHEGQELILIPTKHSILAYDMEGGPVSGWDKIEVEGEILGSLQRIDQEIIAATSYGRIYFYNLSGEKTTEIDVAGDLTFVSNLGIIQKEQSIHFYATDKEGKLHEIHKDGSSKVIYEGKWSNKYSAEFEQIYGTSNPELIVMDGPYLQVFEIGNTVQEVFDYTFTKDVSNKPYYFQADGGLQKMGIATQGTNLIYLFSENGTVAAGFPVEAQPLFYYGKINYNSGNYLICTRRDHKLYAFKH
ncbi:hypothetical protein ACFRAE_03725 [Sphingobacterium sp. HJSM2_6]|uniref:hypothetical protein n=1 Tax=Sphingobacterium sp. HJSM2_6 TaxID=3366264 RepID=UPI003BE5A694